MVTPRGDEAPSNEAKSVLGKRWWRRLLGIGLVIAGLGGQAACAQATTRVSTSPIAQSLIYGTNMPLYDAGDQIANDTATQQLLRREHLPIIRIPSRFTLSDADMLRALRATRSIGAIPLVIVHGPTDPNALADDSHLLALVQSVFGGQTVYVEFGNESDLADIDATRYTQAWNRVIPHLKALAPTYKFAGPVTWNANAAYIAAFDAGANPRPDVNSWHAYACSPGDPDDYCMSRVAGWTTDIREVNAAVRAAIGTTLPLMVTEWNLDAYPDPRYADASFIQAWTVSALRTLAANVPNGLIAAMQYCATNNEPFQLIDGTNQLTPAGQAFFREAARARERAQ